MKIKYGSLPLLFVACLFVGCGKNEEKQYSEEVRALIELVHTAECQKTDGELFLEKLTSEDIVRIRKICEMSVQKKLEFFSSVMQQPQLDVSEGDVSALRQGLTFYYCGAMEIPDQWSTTLICNWHDTNPVECSIQGRVSCLWGCNNVDQMLGWHIKFFNSRADLEKEIGSKGYYFIGSVEGGDYSRQLDYGFRFQVHSLNIDGNGKGTWHSEGPEPSPAFSWFAFLRGWWPNSVRLWHSKC